MHEVAIAQRSAVLALSCPPCALYMVHASQPYTC